MLPMEIYSMCWNLCFCKELLDLYWILFGKNSLSLFISGTYIIFFKIPKIISTIVELELDVFFDKAMWRVVLEYQFIEINLYWFQLYYNASVW